MKVKEESEKVGLKLNIQKTKIMASSPITAWQIDGEKVETVADFIFVGLQNHCRWWLQPWNLKMLTPWKESYDQPRQLIKKQRHYFANKGLSSQGYIFSSSHVWMQRRQWQPTPVFLPGESQGRGSLVAAVYGVTQSWTRLKWLSSSSSSSAMYGASPVPQQ